MKPFEIEAEVRNDRGKGASRRLRRAGKIPAIVYGAHKGPTPIQLGQTDMLLQTENEAFYSHILTLKVDGASERVVLKDMQRHAYKPFITHMDFQRVAEDQELTMRVPLHFVNEERCVGVKTGGGIISRLMTDLEIICLPRHLPEYIEVDVEHLDVGDSVHLADIKMPEGVEIALLQQGGDEMLPVVSVQVQREEEVEVEEGAEEIEAPVAEAEEGDDED